MAAVKKSKETVEHMGQQVQQSLAWTAGERSAFEAKAASLAGAAAAKQAELTAALA
jgi:hypothetical protein